MQAAGVVTGASTTVATSTAGVSDVQMDTPLAMTLGISAVGATPALSSPYGLSTGSSNPLAPLVGQYYRAVVGYSSTAPTVAGVTQTYT